MRVFIGIVVLVCIVSCNTPNAKKIPVLDVSVQHATAQSVVLYLNNDKSEAIDTFQIDEEGILNVYQESIQKVGFYYLLLENGEKINLFLKPDDFVQFSFDINNVKTSCTSKNSAFFNAMWKLEENTELFNQEMLAITHKFRAIIEQDGDDTAYQKLSVDKESLIEKYRTKSLKIVLDVKNPILTYLMLNQVSGNVSLFSVEKDLDLFLKNSEHLMKHENFKPLFSAYDQQLMKSYSIIRSGQNYASGKPFINLQAKTNWGEDLPLDKMNGKLIHVVLWTAEEEYNGEKIIEIKRLMSRYGLRGLKTLMVAYQQDKVIWKNNMTKFRLPYWHLIDTLSVQSSDIQALGVRSLPCNFLVSSKGLIVARELWGDRLNNEVKNYLENN